MTINNLPSSVQQIVLSGWLLRFFNEALFPNLLFRDMYQAMEVPQHLGQTFTFTKSGLLPLATTAITPATTGDITSGLTPVQVGYEQYSATLSQYGQPVATNLLSSGIALADLYRKAVSDLGKNAGQTLDVLGRHTMFQAYLGGRTFATAAATSVTQTVADINGFTFTYVNGVRTAVSVSNPLAVTVTESGVAASRNVTGFSAGTDNFTSDKLPGTLTLSASTAMVIGDTVISSIAPVSVRPNAKTTEYTLASTDILTLANLNNAVAQLRAQAIPTHPDGYYHAYLDPNQAQQLMNDNAVQRVYDTHADSAEFMHGVVAIGAGCKIYQSPAIPRYTNAAGVVCYSGIITGDEAGYEVRSSLIANWMSNLGNLNAFGHVEFSPESYVAMILRPPIDTLQQEVTNTWSFLGSWLPATDSLSTIGGGAGRIYRRCVAVQSA